MPDLWRDLLDCLDLEPVRSPGPAGPGDSGDSPDSAGTVAELTEFDGRNQQLTYHRLFGGQLLAQFVRAAELTCPGKAVKSLHALFPRAGTNTEPVHYEVRRHHDGGTFGTLSIVARQSKGVIATASVSMHAVEDGRVVQTVPAVSPVLSAEHKVEIDLLPWETRTAVDLDAKPAAPPEFELWMRTPELDPALAPAIAAYATDLTLIGTALRAVDGIGQRDAQQAFTSAVTGHTLWFHRPLRTDNWLLLRQHSPILAAGRSFGRGDLLTEDGSLVASYAQEALLRFNS